MIRKWVNVWRHWRAGGAPSARRFLGEFEHNHLHVLSAIPPVVYLWWGRDDRVLHQLLKKQDLLVLYLFPWCFPRDEFPALVDSVKETLTQYPRHRIAFLCNEEYSVSLLQNERVEALFVNQNAFIDEREFQPMADVSKTHDAVYSASLAPYKRHVLAKDIPSLILMSYTYGGTSNEAYQNEVREALKNAWWAKDTREGQAKWSTSQIAGIYNRAHIGLCLSAVEGAMFASMEYLLCGLPVVSTRSIGGRDTFWDERIVTLCEDSSAAVAAAVQTLKSRALPPGEVRELTLAKVEIHRERLRAFLRPSGIEPVIPWPQGSHGPTTWYSLRELARKICDGATLDALP